MWDRVAGLKLALRDHVQIFRHVYRGQTWYVLRDRLSTQHFRFPGGAHYIVRCLDGERTVEEIWQQVCADQGEAAPSQEDLVALLVSLQTNDLLQSSAPIDVAELLERQTRGQQCAWKRFLKSPFLIRLRLLDPDAYLDSFVPSIGPLFGWVGLILWFAAVLTAAVTATAYWPALTAYWADRALAPHHLVILCAVYPLVKGLHELAHAMAVKKWGGEVHEMGIMLLLLMPLPYVDASAAAGFSDKRKRMAVGALGIMTELLLAALALFVWLNVETGLVRDVASAVMLIGGISTLLFNGNPLLRFDGYYVLTDAIEVPNLATRASQYYGYLIKRYLFGLTAISSPVTAPGERGWFVMFGLLSPLYRVVVLIGIVLFVAEKFLIVGVVLGLLAFMGQFGTPLLKQLWFVVQSPILSGQRTRALSLLGLLAAGLAIGLFVVPAPSSSYAQGVTWLPEGSQVRAGADGFITEVLAHDELLVQAGDVLLETKDPLLDARVRALEWQVREIQARYDAQFLTDRAEAGILKEKLRKTSTDLEQFRTRVERMTVRSTASGKFIAPGLQHLPGRFVKQGEVIGYITQVTTPTIRAVVKQADAGLVRDNTTGVRVRLADRAGETLIGVIQSAVPSATSDLPSKALGVQGGGLITTDPSDPTGQRGMEQFFIFDIELPANLSLNRIGVRAYIRFEHQPQPLGHQWLHSMRQLLLRRFSI